MTTEPAQGKQHVCHCPEFAFDRQTEHLQIQLVQASTCRGSFREAFTELAQVEQPQCYHVTAIAANKRLPVSNCKCSALNPVLMPL